MIGQSKVIPNYYSIKKYNNNYYRLTYHNYPIKNGGFEEERNYIKVENTEKLSQSISRARTMIFDYAISNEFDYFVTLTIDKKKMDRYNLTEYIKKFGQFIRNNRKDKGSKIQYLLIPEKHKSGEWHMHGLIKGINENELSINENGYLDWNEYKKRFGYISLSKVKNNIAVAKYITKYISKSLASDDTVTEKEKKLYYVTRGLNKSIKIYEGSGLNDEGITYDYTNDYVKVLDMNKEEYNNLMKRLDKKRNI